MSLENRIRALAKAGQLTHITLAPTWPKKGEPQKWQAGYRDAVSLGYRVEIENDPVDALMKCLNSAPVERKKERPVLI